MRWSRVLRHVCVPTGALLLAAATVLVPAAAASAEGGSVGFSLSGNLGFGQPPEPKDVALTQPEPVTATVGAFGSFTTDTHVSLTSDNPPFGAPNRLLAGPIDQVELSASNLTGAINPGDGTMTVSGQVVYTFRGDGFDCTTEPSQQPLALTSNTYNASTGTATLTPDPAVFTIPAIANGNDECPNEWARFLNDTLQLPTAAGNAALTLNVALDPPVTSPPPPPPSTDPSTTPPVTSGGSGVTVAPVIGSAASAVKPSSTTAKSSTASKSKSSKSNAAAPAASNETTTTAYVWKGGSTPPTFDDQVGETPNARAAAPRLGPQAAAKVSKPSNNNFGFGVIAIILGGALGAFFLLRSEARRMLRRRERAAF
jgi:hypothetical protein